MKWYSFTGRRSAERGWMQAKGLLLTALVIVGAFWSLVHLNASSPSLPNATIQQTKQANGIPYPWHKQIIATVFWVGESADETNAYISNTPSAWIEDWQSAYGGVDSPENRCGFTPCSFTPKENPFYFALPYNDRVDGRAKPTANLKQIPWYTGGTTPNVSWVKNRWIEIAHGNTKGYAQWEDVGPMHEDDDAYVFGMARPKFATAGLDLSPAITDYLHLNGQEPVDWHFIDEKDVPAGPWKNLITTSPAQY